MDKHITFSKAIDGYLLYAHSRRLSKHTIGDYTNTFRKFQKFLAPDDPPLASIDLDLIELFFASLEHLSKKTLVNYHAGLSALWTWACGRKIVEEHVVRQFRPPKPEQPVIEIFTEQEVQLLLFACGRSRSYKLRGKRKCSNARPTALRDKAIIVTLLDSMVRVSELCGMKRSLTNLKDGRIKVMGKGSKERYVPVTSETAGIIWQYLASRPDPKPRYRDFVFLSCTGRSLSTDAVGDLIRELGKKIGVRAYPHKFRHTGATEFIKNGGSALALKDILGHSTMTMVNRYVHLAQVDIEEAHRNASPVYNWDLRV